MGHLSNNTQLSLLSFHSKTGMKATTVPLMKGKGLKPRKAISLHGHQRAQGPRGLKDQAEPGRLFRSGWGDRGWRT